MEVWTWMDLELFKKLRTSGIFFLSRRRLPEKASYLLAAAAGPAAAAQHQQRRSEKEVADLQAELREERNFSFQQRAHISALESRCRKAEKLLKMIPAEELKKFLSSQRVRLR